LSKKKSDDDLDEVQDEYIEDEVTGSLDPDDATGEISVTNLSKEEELDELEDEALEQGDKASSKFQELLSQLPFLSKILPQKTKGDAGEEETDDLDEEEEEEKPKKKLKVIHIVIIIGLALLVLHEDEEKPETKTGTKTAPKVVPKYKKKKKVAAPVEEPRPTEPEPEPEPEPVEPEPVEPEPVEPEPIEPEPVQPEPVEPEPSDSEIDNTVDDFSPSDDSSSDNETVEDVEGQLDNLFEEDNIVNQPSETTQDNDEGSNDSTDEVPYEVSLPDQPEVDSSGEELLTFDDEIVNKVMEGEGENEDQITTSILRELEKEAKKKKDLIINNKRVEPTEAPSYLTVGRGLVYNCVDKHWACVDTASFKQCGDNYAWRLKNSEAVQCYPNEFYDSDMDCASMQQYKIDMTVDTDFCK
tara:strand:+ start:179033 stop:180271 length:1239 start_codon:yes stop_codon:yes gene_type:complete